MRFRSLRDTASQVVRAAWGEGDHTDLVHRIEELVGRGATLAQVARIVAPVGHLTADGDREPQGGPDAG